MVFGAPSAHGQAEILGVPKEVMTAWSKRTAQIAAEAAPVIADYEATLGRSLTRNERAAVTKTAVLKTREGKEPAGSVSVLHERWQTEAAALGWGAESPAHCRHRRRKTLRSRCHPRDTTFAVAGTAVTEPFAVAVTPD